jgi:hypothetical protein
MGNLICCKLYNRQIHYFAVAPLFILASYFARRKLPTDGGGAKRGVGASKLKL